VTKPTSPFPFMDHLSLAEIDELRKIGDQRNARGQLPYGTAKRYAELARKRRPPVYVKRDEPDDAA
jgi:hypothetical protein